MPLDPKPPQPFTHHPVLGTNPRVTFCPRCKRDTTRIVYCGDRNFKVRCPSCTALNYSAFLDERCSVCNSFMLTGQLVEYEDGEKVPAPGLCASCIQEVGAFQKVVSEGGVYFRCTKCSAEGVLTADNPMAVEVRLKSSVASPDPVGFEVAFCPRCTLPGTPLKPSENQ